jgi:cytochrome P450
MTSVTNDPAAALTAEGCPVEHFSFAVRGRPPMSGFREMGELGRRRPVFRSPEAQGYWVFTRHEAIQNVFADPGTFSSSAIFAPEPDPPYRFIPTMLDPPEHTAWRRLLAPLFAPGAIREIAPHVEQRCRALVAEVAGRGECDFVADVALRFPGSVFLEIMGLPQERLDEWVSWMEDILHTPAEQDPDGMRRMTGIGQVYQVFAERLAILRADPEARGSDILSRAVTWEIDGAPIPDDQLMSFCLLMFMAGLDTVAAQLSYMVLHLATHPEDRRRLTAEPEIVEPAVEEMMRAFPIVQPARKVTRDLEFNGCALKAGDMVMVSLPFSGRDADRYPDPDRVDFDREHRPNLSFGGGVHRCVGSALARRELIVALRAWHAAVPEYEVAPGAELTEYMGPTFGLDRLPLRWVV